MLSWSMQAEERIERAKCGQFRSEIGRGGIQRWDGARTFVEPDSAWCRLLLALGSVLQQLRVLGSAIVAAPNEIEQGGHQERAMSAMVLNLMERTSSCAT